MRRRPVSIMIIIAGVLLLAPSTYAKNKYDFLLKQEGIQKQIDFYETNIKKMPLLMDYLNAVVSSPEALYAALDEHGCDKEILKFVKKNKSFTVKLVHISIVMDLNTIGINDNEFAFVTNYIKSPTAMAATNAQEMGIETSLMRQMPVFKLYELYTKPGGLKEAVEKIFFLSIEKRNK
jgi:hypothetical protein